MRRFVFGSGLALGSHEQLPSGEYEPVAVLAVRQKTGRSKFVDFGSRGGITVIPQKLQSTGKGDRIRRHCLRCPSVGQNSR